jgi:CubicO group peptidase (beta-lactamase class C family)
LVVAIGVMRLAEAGTLDLDADVSGWLGWSLRNPAFPDRPISLRMLLSHTSSLRDDVDYALPFDHTIEQALAGPRAWDARHAPGGWFTYANINFPVVASVMEKSTGERFDRLMHRLVIVPMKLKACFNWTTCDDRALARAVTLYDPDGISLRDDLHGSRPDCPIVPAASGDCDLSRWRPGANGTTFSPQGGLRISARDLARIGQMLLNAGRVRGRPFLSPSSVEALLRPAWRYDGGNGDTERGFHCAYGLASMTIASGIPGCRDDPFGDGTRRYGHAGEAYGLRSGLWIDPAKRTGTVYFHTGLPAAPPYGESAFTAAEEKLARGER